MPALLIPRASEPEAAPGADRKAETPLEYKKAVELKSASSEVSTAWPALLTPNAMENSIGAGSGQWA